MAPANRREFLKLCLASAPALALSKAVGAELQSDGVPGATTFRSPQSIARYIDPLPLLKTLKPIGPHDGSTLYRMRMVEFSKQMHSQLPATKLWGYEGQYPGPVIEAFRDRQVEVRWENHLPSQHIFSIDPHIHGAMPPAPVVRTVPHLHGSRSRSESDGLPERWFTPGNSASYTYPNGQQAATLWYHDHAVGITRLNVYAGLSGFYLLRDEEERAAELPAGEYEIPLIVQDRTLDDAGQLVYAPTHEDGVKLPPGVWGPEFFGELPVVNGSLYPYHEVEPRPYRVRILNGCNSRFLNLYFNLAKSVTDIPSLAPVSQIGSDGGLLPKPVAINKLLLGPAERADLIIDFSRLEGRTVTLSNDAAAPFPAWGMNLVHHAPLLEWMQFRVVLPATAKGRAFSFAGPKSFRKLDATATIKTRDFILSETLDKVGRSLGVRINGKGYDDPVTEVVELGSTEKWRFINTTDDAHPMHLHLVQFQILERQGFDSVAFMHGSLELVGLPRVPAANEAGWKDTAVVNPRDVLTILVKFEGYTGRYVFHCHMLEHEDNDMMRPFEVVANAVKS